MNKVLNLNILGEPMAVQSVKACRIGKSIRTYQPKKVTDWKAYIKVAISEQLPADWVILSEPLAVKYVLTFPILKSMNKKTVAHITSGGVVYKDKKPDLDNCVKGLADCLSGLVWVDDSLVVKLQVEKIFGVTPSIKIDVYSGVS